MTLRHLRAELHRAQLCLSVLERDLRSELASLPAAYGFSSGKEFIAAVIEASSARRRKRTKKRTRQRRIFARRAARNQDQARTFTWLSRRKREACINDAKKGMTGAALMQKYGLKASAIALVRRKAASLQTDG